MGKAEIGAAWLRGCPACEFRRRLAAGSTAACTGMVLELATEDGSTTKQQRTNTSVICEVVK